MTAENIFWYAVVFLILFGGSMLGFVQHLQSRRHKFKLAMQRERTAQKRADADVVAEQNRKRSLEIRAAELEIERYDRHIPGAPPVPRLVSGVDPDDINQLSTKE